MHSPESLVVFTAAPLERWNSGQEGNYRNIVGIELGSRALHLTALEQTHHAPQPEPLEELPPDMREPLFEYYGRFMVDNPYAFNYSCDNFAAFIRGDELDPQAAMDAAGKIVETGRRVDRLEAGEHGVWGIKKPGRGLAHHSAIGLGPKRDEVIQVDGKGNMMSLVPYAANRKLYEKGETGLYAPRRSTALARATNWFMRGVQRQER